MAESDIIQKHLTLTDMKALAAEPSAQLRAQLADKIALDFRVGNFNAAEAKIARDIFRLLVKDTEKSVRRALAEQLAYCPHTPREIILKLAHDDVDVATPVLEYSSLLTEDDLIAVIHSTREVLKWRAIARRGTVPADVASCLMETHSELALADLFKNKGAVLKEGPLLVEWDYIRACPTLLQTLVYRGGLPLSIAEKLFAAVSEELKHELIERYKFNTPVMHKAVNDVREWKMLGIVPRRSDSNLNDEGQVEDLVDELFVNGRLTPSLLVRALCMGTLNLFEAGLAKLARVPRVNTRILLLEGGEIGFDAIYSASGMPRGFAQAMKILLRISLEESGYGHEKPADFRKHVLERIYAAGYNHSVDNMEYLLALLGGKTLAAA